MQNNNTADFLIIGGGIIGINIALSLRKKYSTSKIILMEKESACGIHASGRNSGVLHAGFYYPSNSLKAKFTKNGNDLLTEYCKEKNIPINNCGKLVVAKNEEDFEGLNELIKRAKSNGVILHELTEKEAKEIEPRVKTYQKALFSPTTSSVNPTLVVSQMEKDAIQQRIDIRYKTAFIKRLSNNIILSSKGKFEAGYIINAAGLYADKIALAFGFSKDYRILPFKGIYLYSNEPAYSIRTNIYPVPDLQNPFLGVHFTIDAHGKTKIGPTAMPAFWREQYSNNEQFNLMELITIVCRQMNLLFSAKFNFKQLAFGELKKYHKPHLINLASQLAEHIALKNFLQFGKPGIRAQLVNIKTKKLEMDFIIEDDKHSMHILNAVSPGFTSAIPFSQFIFEKINNNVTPLF